MKDKLEKRNFAERQAATEKQIDNIKQMHIEKLVSVWHLDRWSESVVTIFFKKPGFLLLIYSVVIMITFLRSPYLLTHPSISSSSLINLLPVAYFSRREIIILLPRK